jgi:hypothetical protein
MFLETLFEIGGHAYVALTLWTQTLDKINVIQLVGPPSLKLRRASRLTQRIPSILGKRLRREAGCRSCEAQGGAKQDGGGEIRTHDSTAAPLTDISLVNGHER